MAENFESILNLSTVELQSLPTEKILLSIQEVLNHEEDAYPAFEFSFTRFPDILSLSEIDKLICQQLLPHLKSKFDEAIACVDCEQTNPSTTDDECLNLIQTIFEWFLKLSENVYNKLDDVDKFCLKDVQSILLNSLDFLCKTISHNYFYSQDQIKILLGQMQDSISNFLISPKLQLRTNLNVLQNGQKVLMGLIQLGHHQSQKNDLKSMANTWKHLSKFAKDFHTIYHLVQQQNPMGFQEHNEDLLNWISFCVQNICDLITSNVHNMIETTSDCNQKVIIPKITSFYLKLLENLSKEYSNEDFRGQNQLINLYEMIVNISDQCDDNETGNYLLILSNGLASVLSNVFNCDRFSTELLINFSGDHIHVCLEIIRQLLLSFITSNDFYLNRECKNRNILYHLLHECIPKEMHHIYNSETLYDELITLCSLLILTTINQKNVNSLEYILIETTISDDNLYHTIILLDIWTLLIRYVSDETRLMYCRLWLKMSFCFPVIPRNPSCVLVQKLFKHTMGLLSETHRSEVLQELSQSTLSKSVSNFVSNHEVSKLKQFAQDTIKIIKKTLSKLNPSSEIVSSTECFELISALSWFQLPASTYLLRNLNDATLTNCLTDVLSKLKTCSVQVLLFLVLRILLWQKYLCNSTSVQIDYSDSSEMQKYYIIEMVILLQSKSVAIDSKLILDKFGNTDDLVKVQVKRITQNIKFNGHSQNDEVISDCTADDTEYIQQILGISRHFGCTSNESCLNQNETIKRRFEHILLESQQLERTIAIDPQINLGQFSNEITKLSSFFNRLQNKI